MFEISSVCGVKQKKATAKWGIQTVFLLPVETKCSPP